MEEGGGRREEGGGSYIYIEHVGNIIMHIHIIHVHVHVHWHVFLLQPVVCFVKVTNTLS